MAAFVVFDVDIVVLVDVAYGASTTSDVVVAIRSSRSRYRARYSARMIGGCRLLYLPLIYDTLLVTVGG